MIGIISLIVIFIVGMIAGSLLTIGMVVVLTREGWVLYRPEPLPQEWKNISDS